MKTTVLYIALLFSFVMSAQNIKPNFEKDGELVKATYFHENGEISQTGYFLKGKLHGEWVMYNEEGEKNVLGQYANGLKTGKWFYWEGEELREVDFVDNKIANVKKWNNSNGVVYTN